MYFSDKEFENAYRRHLARVGMVLETVFDLNPKPVVDRISEYYGSLPGELRFDVLHDDPLDLAIGWGRLNCSPNDPLICEHYSKLEQSAEWNDRNPS